MSVLEPQPSMRPVNHWECPSSLDGHEFALNGIKFEYLGPTVLSAHDAYAFDSQDPDGRWRTFAVYHSVSEGRWRATQGLQQGNRIIKGPELWARHQYTQDTQLNRAFEAQAVSRISDTDPSATSQSFPELELDLDGTYTACADFQLQVASLALGSQTLDRLLTHMPAGNLSYQYLSESLGLEGEDMNTVNSALLYNIDLINQHLISDGAVPDFNQRPVGFYEYQHPHLGLCRTEIFRHPGPDGRVQEWHMARDLQGNFWIDRIRLADAQPTVYGTDAQIIYSGVLTSKPMDYGRTVTAVPEAYRQVVDQTPYSRITDFLGQLVPIQQFKQHYSRQDFEDRPIGM